MGTVQAETRPQFDPEEAARQAVYAFLARVLAAPVDASETDTMAPFAADSSALGRAFIAFRDALSGADPDRIAREYHDLFIGLGRGELVPYGSYYLTGFLNEKPLADLRRTNERLGFARAEGVSEPEDHIASLCETMAILIGGTATGEFTVYDQDGFFKAHIGPWAERFFADLASAESADLYRTVGKIGEVFMQIEEEGFTLLVRA